MLIVKRIPWFSLALVMLSYATLGWMISQVQAPWYVWLVIVIGILLVLAGLTMPWRKAADYYAILLKSNTRAFGVAVLAAFLFFVMLAWFKIFLDTLLMLAASILAKIDFQASGVRESLAFCFTSIFALLGLATGALIHQLI
jgi:hypothetical protein